MSTCRLLQVANGGEDPRDAEEAAASQTGITRITGMRFASFHGGALKFCWSRPVPSLCAVLPFPRFALVGRAHCADRVPSCYQRYRGHGHLGFRRDPHGDERCSAAPSGHCGGVRLAF